MAIAIDFAYHKIQPLKDRMHHAFLFFGLDDPTREDDKLVSEEKVFFRVSQFFTGDVYNLSAPKSFSVYHSPMEVRVSVPL